MVKRMVIYHGGCADGFCAAWLFHKEYPDAEYLPAVYGDEAPDVTRKIVYIVDFSYPRDVLLRMYDQAELLVVLDHHKTAQADLEGLAFCKFDMEKSGGRLAWEYLCDQFTDFWSQWPDRAMPPWLVNYTEDRDLWRWELPDSRAINANLRSYPMDFETWDKFSGHDIDLFAMAGESILRDQALTVRAKVEQSHVVTVPTETEWPRWRVANATTLISETAGELAKETMVGCCWFELPDGARVYSLRTCPESCVDCSRIAKRFGGGGHQGAAGFKLESGAPHPWGSKLTTESGEG